MLKYGKCQFEEGQPPNKKLISEGDIFVKNLAIKQQNVKTSLQEQLSNYKSFLPGYEDVPLQNTGISTLKEFKEHINLTELIGKLKSAGLTETDIGIYLDNNVHRLQETRKNLNYNVMQERLEKIEDMIRDYSLLFESNFNLTMRKLVKEEVVSIKPNSLETKLLMFFINNKQEDEISEPMKEIQKINNKITNNLKSSLLETNKIRRKARKLQKRLNVCSKQNCQIPIPENSKINISHKNCKWDVKEQSTEYRLDKTFEKEYTCKNTKYFTIMDEKIIKINQTNEIKNECFKKLDIKAIQSIPKFKNYNLGIQSKKLYLKNLAKTTSEHVLFNIFKNILPCSEITLKLMKGKMRGQAFVEFPNINLAVEALNKINGLIVNNKPIVAEFSKSKLK